MAQQSIPVNSTCIAYMRYDDETEELQFGFQKGGSYIINKIPQIEVERWAQSESPGGYFNSFIKGNY